MWAPGRAWLVCLWGILLVSCDEDPVGPVIPSVAGVYQGTLSTLQDRCLGTAVADVTAQVRQEGERITIQTDDGLTVEGTISENGVFTATWEAVRPVHGPFEVIMFGQFDGNILLATRVMELIFGDVLCGGTENMELVREGER